MWVHVTNLTLRLSTPNVFMATNIPNKSHNPFLAMHPTNIHGNIISKLEDFP